MSCEIPHETTFDCSFDSQIIETSDRSTSSDGRIDVGVGENVGEEVSVGVSGTAVLVGVGVDVG
jgi:hypothetical protein